MNTKNLSSLIWSIADLLRGDYKRSDFGKVILPFTVLARVEAVLAPTRQDVVDEYNKRKDLGIPLNAILTAKSQNTFYNTSEYTLAKLKADSDNLRANLITYLDSFSDNIKDIFNRFKFIDQIHYLDEANLLYKIIERFTKEDCDLSPEAVSNYEMGNLFEELIRKFAEESNETAGEHFTPRDIVRLATSLIFSADNAMLTDQGVVRSIYDPTVGTGGFLTSASEYIAELNPNAHLKTYGQELNPESFAICKADILIKGEDADNIKFGNTLSDDQLTSKKFDYMLSNPPFGVEWKKVEKAVKDEHKIQGYNGRFGAGLPRVSDGSLLFLMHLISKMRPSQEGGSRIGIILNGSPLFTGGAGSGESEIRRYVLENDLLEAIIALPTDMFFNTGISTYIWMLSNKKSPERKGKVQLINAADKGSPMRKSLGSKRKYLDEDVIADIVQAYGNFEQTKTSKLFDYTEFGFRRVTIERPLKLAFYPKDENNINALKEDNAFLKLKDEQQQEILNALTSCKKEEYLSRDQFIKDLNVKLTAAQFKLLQKHFSQTNDNAEICVDSKGNPEPNTDLRDYENIPLQQDIYDYFEKEVKPHVADSWIDESKRDEKDGNIGIVGYEIPFNRYFYEYKPPRALAEIDAELDAVTKEILALLGEVHS
ncbi:type I restriction-modification system subunit M [Fastidiosibacter lacustris]|uniref:type I restriction-modification system subunit M n=1 Tax=Fastidiosibacter lacustris TaxID=2056695 RepID=UPI000E34750F|nr:class I SAM-dependent DNA methyltransferase [Fastidiosibacter lacustris]